MYYDFSRDAKQTAKRTCSQECSMFDFSIDTKFFSIEWRQKSFYLRIVRRELTWLHPDYGFDDGYWGFSIS